MAAGYSNTPLIKKLGIKEGFKTAILRAPQPYWEMLGPLPRHVFLQEDLSGTLDFIHIFTTAKKELQNQIPRLKEALSPRGMIWISWPKGSSGAKTDLKESLVREIGLKHGLVDVKICAVDETWSALKFVFRTRDRKPRSRS